MSLNEAAEPLLALLSLWAMYRVHKDFAGRMVRSENWRTLGARGESSARGRSARTDLIETSPSGSRYELYSRGTQ